MSENMHIYKDTAYTTEARAENLLSLMTTEEKIGQLIQNEGFNKYDKSADGTVTIKEEWAAKVKSGDIGNVWGFFRADWWTGRNFDNGITKENAAQAANEMQKLALSSRLAIPMLLAEECAHGLMALGATVFPTGLGQAATFNPKLIREMSEVIAKETRAVGAHIAYGPICDVARDPRWSRVEEGYGEDPCLISKMAEAMVKGLQGDDFNGKSPQVISTLKHFAAHGEPESGHNSAPSHVGDRDLFNVHLPGFKAGVDAGALSVMSSYNDVDGDPCSGSYRMLTGILRDMWDFEGFVVSDAGSIPGLEVAQRVAANDMESAAIALHAGVDLELCSSTYENSLKKALEAGLVSYEDLDTAVMRVLKLKFRMGLFENPFIDQSTAVQTVGNEENKKVALEVARQSMTLLKNDGVLPLKDIKTIAVIGPNADTQMNQLGDYTAPQEQGSISTVLKGIKAVCGDKEVIYAKGCKVRKVDKSGFDEAISAAEKAEAIVLVLGGSSSPDGEIGFLSNGAARVQEVANDSEFDKDSGEGYDRGKLDLAGVQLELLKKLKETGKPVITVLIMGRPLIIKPVIDMSDAVLLAWYPGCMGGMAAGEAIFGAFSPSGRLPLSIPLDVGQLPIYYNTSSGRGDYIDLQGRPYLRFGYGLSYTSFTYANMVISPAVIPVGLSAEVSVDITNTGSFDSDEVAQLYIRDKVASAVRPHIELKAFERVAIKAGQTKRITFTVGYDELAFYGKSLRQTVEPGEFDIMIGGNSEHHIQGLLTVR